MCLALLLNSADFPPFYLMKFTDYKWEQVVWGTDMLSDTTPDVNRDSEIRTRLTGPSSKIERNTHGSCFMLRTQCHPEIEPTPVWRASRQYTGPRGQSTSWSR